LTGIGKFVPGESLESVNRVKYNTLRGDLELLIICQISPLFSPTNMLDFLGKFLNSFYMSGLKIGDVDVVDQVLQNEYDVKLIYKILNFIFLKGQAGQPITPPTPEELDEMRQDVVRELQQKYPNSGVQLIR
jgi:hypothetical protein